MSTPGLAVGDVVTLASDPKQLLTVLAVPVAAGNVTVAWWAMGELRTAAVPAGALVPAKAGKR